MCSEAFNYLSSIIHAVSLTRCVLNLYLTLFFSEKNFKHLVLMTAASSSSLGMLMSLFGASLVLENTKSTLRMSPHFGTDTQMLHKHVLRHH